MHAEHGCKIADRKCAICILAALCPRGETPLSMGVFTHGVCARNFRVALKTWRRGALILCAEHCMSTGNSPKVGASPDCLCVDLQLNSRHVPGYRIICE